MDRLSGLVADNPPQVARVQVLRQRYQTWQASVAGLASGTITEEQRGKSSLGERRDLMDDVRAEFSAILTIENGLRGERASAFATTQKFAGQMLLGLFVALAVVLAGLSRNQLRGIASTYESVLASERLARTEVEDEAWIRSGLVNVGRSTQGDVAVRDLGERVLKVIAPYVAADVGAFFARDQDGTWRRRAGYALDARAAGPDTFAAGQGLVGKAADSGERVMTVDVPPGYLQLRSGTGALAPNRVLFVCARLEETAHAVVELGFLHAAPKRVEQLLERAGEAIALAIRSAEYKERLRELLSGSQRQAEQLQTQQEELRVTNEELEEQGNALRTAQAQLEERKEELEVANAYLAAQKADLEKAQSAVVEKAAEVERASRFKSEFLANMSHELRTPLNSTLILAKLLADNGSGNLTPEQVRYASTIHSAGNDLLTLINDVLDLSKVEAGKLDLHVGVVHTSRVVDGLGRIFEPVAKEKKLAFSIEVAPDVPSSLETDSVRLDQILRNLLSNALKFTDQGRVSLSIHKTPSGQIAFAVRDTGIGISAEQQTLIFEAFRQADGGASRKHGGTGLGLSISRDLAHLLGGDIEVESEVGKGSLFTLTIPAAYAAASPPRGTNGVSQAGVAYAPPSPVPVSPVTASAATSAFALDASIVPAPRPARRHPAVVDDRDRQEQGSTRYVLVIEDDVAFAQILLDLAHEHKFLCIVSHDAEGGLALASRFNPCAVILDLNLPDHSGLSVLDRLKRNPATRHVPVHVVSVEDRTQAALSMGAIGYLRKPVLREQLVTTFQQLDQRLARGLRRLLIVEDDARQRESLVALLGGQDVEVVAVARMDEALAALHAGTFDCVVTDLTLPDATGFELLEHLARDEAYAFPPVIVYTGRSLTPAEEQRLGRYSTSIIVKGARSPERLLDEVSLFLHRVESDLPPERQRMLRSARDREAVFDGRSILVVEDDVRNVFALTSILEGKGVKVSIARNGREALDVLAKADAMDLVLMDVMMPEMDGLQATREIRLRPQWAKLPVIALTAKAMADDREKCLHAGANDYLSKPLDTDVLLSLLRVWLPR
ncbi:MAG TPA: response regulator, partial [Polyangiaceae bacterium]